MSKFLVNMKNCKIIIHHLFRDLKLSWGFSGQSNKRSNSVYFFDVLYSYAFNFLVRFLLTYCSSSTLFSFEIVLQIWWFLFCHTDASVKFSVVKNVSNHSTSTTWTFLWLFYTFYFHVFLFSLRVLCILVSILIIWTRLIVKTNKLIK